MTKFFSLKTKRMEPCPCDDYFYRIPFPRRAMHSCGGVTNGYARLAPGICLQQYHFIMSGKFYIIITRLQVKSMKNSSKIIGKIGKNMGNFNRKYFLED